MFTLLNSIYMYKKQLTSYFIIPTSVHCILCRCALLAAHLSRQYVLIINEIPTCENMGFLLEPSGSI